MLTGDGFSSLYFYSMNSDKSTIYRLKLNGYNEIIKNPRVVEYDKKYYIKPGNENFVLEFDYDGNFIAKRKIQDEE